MRAKAARGIAAPRRRCRRTGGAAAPPVRRSRFFGDGARLGRLVRFGCRRGPCPDPAARLAAGSSPRQARPLPPLPATRLRRAQLSPGRHGREGRGEMDDNAQPVPDGITDEQAAMIPGLRRSCFTARTAAATIGRAARVFVVGPLCRAAIPRRGSVRTAPWIAVAERTRGRGGAGHRGRAARGRLRQLRAHLAAPLRSG